MSSLAVKQTPLFKQKGLSHAKNGNKWKIDTDFCVYIQCVLVYKITLKGHFHPIIQSNP